MIKNLTFFLLGFLIMIFAGIASAEQIFYLDSSGRFAANYHDNTFITEHYLLTADEYQQLTSATSNAPTDFPNHYKLACESFDSSNQCLSWVPVTFLGLYEPTQDEALRIVASYSLFLATIAGYRKLRTVVT